ncbi:MAG: hypothetical protein ACW97A_05035 [Candidatus Thorarchaeota archaeon]|jgi:hypothetical protein
MREVGKAVGISLLAPSDSFFSYFNSPYTGHKNGAAIDIYPQPQEWGCIVPSPISGIISRIRKVKMGKAKEFPTEPYDFGIGINAEDGDDYLVRVMHARPEVREGDIVEVGDPIGHTIRSRYFNYWTGPHYHVEVLKKQDFHRSTQSVPLEVNAERLVAFIKDASSELECNVHSVTPDHVMVSSPHSPFGKSRDLYGHLAMTQNGAPIGLLDAGLPHYAHGGIIANSNVSESNTVHGWRTILGEISSDIGGRSSFEGLNTLNISLDGVPVRGVSCFIYTENHLVQGVPPIQIVPNHYKEFSGRISEGDTVLFSISNR